MQAYQRQHGIRYLPHCRNAVLSPLRGINDRVADAKPPLKLKGRHAMSLIKPDLVAEFHRFTTGRIKRNSIEKVLPNYP